MLICGTKYTSHLAATTTTSTTGQEEIELKCHNFAGDSGLLLARCARIVPAGIVTPYFDLKFGPGERARLLAAAAARRQLDANLEAPSSLDGLDRLTIEEVEEAEEACERHEDGSVENDESKRQAADNYLEERLSMIISSEKQEEFNQVEKEEDSRLERLRLQLPQLNIPPSLPIQRHRGGGLAANFRPREAMISYCHGEAREPARQLKSALERLGVSVYLDLDEIECGLDWQDSLNGAVLACRALIALVTPSYGETIWTARELKLADLVGKLIIPVNFCRHWPPPALAIQFATCQYIEWPSQFGDNLNKRGKADRKWRKWRRKTDGQKEGAREVAARVKRSLEALELSCQSEASPAPSSPETNSDSAVSSASDLEATAAAGKPAWHQRWHSAGHKLLHRLRWPREPNSARKRQQQQQQQQTTTTTTKINKSSGRPASTT